MSAVNIDTSKHSTTRPSDNINPNDVLRDFLEAMAAAGIPAPDDLKTDTAEIQRFYIDGGKRGNKDGAYILHTDFPPNGGFQNHRGGEWIPYSYDWRKAGELGKQWYAYSRTEEGQAEMAAKEKERKEAAARAKAERRSAVKARFEERAKAPDPAFGYLISKKIEGERAEAYGVKQGVNDYGYQALMVPYHNIDGEFMTYQEISADGKFKSFKCEVDGGFFAFGGVDALKAAPKDAPIYIGEGFATVASVAGANEATGATLNEHFSAVSAGDAGKLKRCAEAIYAAFPERKIIFLADDDIKTEGNPGLTKANEAAAAVRSMDGTGAIVVVKPPFDRNAPAQAELSDWNDFYTLHIDAGGDSASFKLALINAVTKANADAITEAEHAAAAETDTGTAPKKEEPVLLPSLLDEEIEAAPVSAEYLIKNWIPQKCEIFFYGDSGVGKSFVGIDIAMCIAHSGIDSWQGYKVNHGDIVYISGEGNEGLIKRVRAWRQVYGVPNFHMLIIPKGVSIDQSDGVAKIIATINARGVKPSLIVIDTLFRNFAGDENSTKDVKLFLDGTDSLRNYFKCSTLTIHHTGKDAKRGMRGNSSIFGACDVVIKATKGTGNTVILEAEKTKDGQVRKMEVPFEEVSLNSIVDADGDLIKTLVVKHEGGEEIECEEVISDTGKLSNAQWDTFKAILTAGERYRLTGEKGEFVGIERDKGKDVLIEEAVLNDPTKKESSRTAYYRNVGALEKKGKLTVTNGIIRFKGPFSWLIEEYLLNA